MNGVTPDNDGNITLSASSVGAVGYNTPQNLTDVQKQQARDNINAPAPYEAGDNIAITGRVITTKSFPCNPNLLDNWYFGKPVNQRGQTSWNVTDAYTIDRWKIEGYRLGDKGVTLNNNFVTIFDNTTADSGYIGIYQPLENNLAENTEITVSALTATGLCVFSTTVPEAAATVRAKDFQNFTLFFYTVSGHQSVVIRCKAGQSESFYAVKLEIGPQQTLAHQENGVWVMNEVPNYGEQLVRCMWYYEKKTVRVIDIDTRTLYLCENFSPKRAYPAITLSVSDYSNLKKIVNAIWMTDDNSVSGVLGDLTNVDEQAHYYGTMTISADL